jgi:hypothetical protein
MEHVDSAHPEELDPIFYEAVIKSQGQPGVGGGSSIPFSDDEGPKVMLYGTVRASENMAVDVDVRVPDATAPGGMLGLGKVLMEGPGTFELAVPVNKGLVELQAFQDPDTDGPSTSDPFAQAHIEVGTSDVEVTLELVAGGWSMGGPVHQNMPSGSEGGELGTQGVPPDPDQPDPFASYSGHRVRVGGRLSYQEAGTVDLDIFQESPSARGGRQMIGKLKLSTGSYELEIPEHFGALIFEAFIDLDGNMRADATDPMGSYIGNPIRVGDVDIWNVDINLSVQDDGKMPTPAAPAGAVRGREI